MFMQKVMLMTRMSIRESSQNVVQFIKSQVMPLLKRLSITSTNTQKKIAKNYKQQSMKRRQFSFHAN